MESNTSRSVWFLVLILGCLFVGRFAFAPPQTMDYWFFLAKGQRLEQSGLRELGKANPFVFTAKPGHTFYDKEWLFAWGLHKLYQTTGHAGTVIAKGVVIFLLWLLFLGIARKLGASPWLTLAIFVWGVSTVLVSRFSIRPHLLGYLFLLIMFYLLLESPKPRHLLIMGGVFMVWANIHGSFVMAGALLGSYGLWSWSAPWFLAKPAPELAERAKSWRLWWILLLSLPVLLCLNPYGWKLWLVIWAFQKEASASSDPFVVPEWIAFQISNPYGLALVILLVLTLVSWGVTTNRKYTERLGWIAVVALLGVSNLRFVGLAFLLLGPLLAAQLQAIPSQIVRWVGHGGMYLLALIFGIQAWAYAPANQLQPDLRGQPEEVLEPLLKHTMSGRIYTNIHPSAYLAFRLPPQYRSSYDAHVITPGFSAWALRYKQTLFEPQAWEEYCTQHRCNLVLLDMADQRSMLVAAHLYRHRDWFPIQMTLRWVLYAHKERTPGSLQPYSYRVLRSFYSLDDIVRFQSQDVVIQQELGRLRSHQQHGNPLAAALSGFLDLDKLQAMPFSPRVRESRVRQEGMIKILEQMQRAYVDAPWHPGVHLGMGLALSALRHPRAVFHLQRAADWNPIWVEPKVALIRYWLHVGRHREAQLAIRQLLQAGRLGHLAWQRLQPILRTRP